jgi:hypothetical protein
VIIVQRYLIVLARRGRDFGYQYRYPIKRLVPRILVAALAVGLVMVGLGWGRANPPWYDPFRTRELAEAKWIAPWTPLCEVKDSRPCLYDKEKCRCGTPTPTPTLRPTIALEDRVGPPTGPGAEIGKPYQFFLRVACGVRDARFDGRWWVADPIVGVDPPESDWTADETLVPPHVSGYGVYGTMVLVTEDLAVFTSMGGRSFEFIPWRSDKMPFGCY